MAIHDRRRASRWTCLLLMMGSTASALSLSNFQPITAATISLGCILAYDAEIPGCSINDFVAGSTCSTTCVKGLKRVETTIESVCEGADASELSLLGQALKGNLVGLLCPGTSPKTSRSPSPAPATSTTVLQRTSSEPPLTFTTVRPPSTTRATTSTATTETDADTETEEPETSTSTSSATTTAPPDTPLPTFIQSSPPTSTSSTPTSTTQSAQDGPRVVSGGGSPFDVVVSGSKQLTASWVKAMALSLGLNLLLLQ